MFELVLMQIGATISGFVSAIFSLIWGIVGTISNVVLGIGGIFGLISNVLLRIVGLIPGF
jgi:phage-related protein